MAVVLLVPAASTAEDAATKRDRQGPVTVTVTLIEPSSSSTKVRVALETRSVSPDGIAFEEAVSMGRVDGADVAPPAVDQVTGGGHHRQAVVVFPPAAGATEVRIIVKNVGGIAERTFRWEPAARAVREGLEPISTREAGDGDGSCVWDERGREAGDDLGSPGKRSSLCSSSCEATIETDPTRDANA